MGIPMNRAAVFVAAFAVGLATASVPTRQNQEHEGKSLFFRAHAAAELAQRAQLLERAVVTSKKELAEHPDDPEFQFWHLENLGALATTKRNFSSLRTIRKLESELDGFVKNHPSHAFAGGLRSLGNLYREAPRFISIGSTKKAEECFRRALALSPEFPGNHIALIDLLWHEGRLPEAKEVLSNLMKMQGWEERRYGDFEHYKAEWQQKVKRWLE